jgi:Outer membrane protein and related peptidoglycan-associated (lipo)proteins
MKRVLGVVLVLLVCASPVVLAQEADAEGCTDSTTLTRMRGCIIVDCNKKEYDAAELIVAADQQSQSVEGEVEIVNYTCPASMSLLMIARNAENALKPQGYATVFSGTAVNDWPVITARKGSNWVSVETNESPGYKQTIVRGTEMEQQMVASAAEMEAEIARSGQYSMYGVLFDTGKATIQPESEKVLGEVASLLKKNASWRMQIEGHTDNVGAKDANLKLSQQRAEAVRAWLVAKGVPGARLVAKGFGDSKPVVGNDTEEGRAKNRRVTLVKL